MAVAETEELEPAELEWLTEKFGDLRWSTATNNRRNEPLKLTECSLTPRPASVALPAVNWYRHGKSRGNLPTWVKEDLARAARPRSAPAAS